MFDQQNTGWRQSFLFYNWHFHSTVSVGWYTSMMAVCGLVVLKIVGKPIPCCLYLSIITYPNTQPLTHPCIHQNTHTRTHTDDHPLTNMITSVHTLKHKSTHTYVQLSTHKPKLSRTHQPTKTHTENF